MALAGASSVIAAVSLEKRYGPRVALRAVTFELPRGGFLVVTGRNGSGKSTLLRLLTGLGAPTRGKLAVAADRGEIGYLGHEPSLYRDLTVAENLELFGRLYRVEALAQRADALLDRLDVSASRAARVGTLSRGMTQRVALCRALLHKPDLLLLDEPHTALDSSGGEILDALLAEVAPHTTVVVSSHDPERLSALTTAQLALA
jgi:heme exporter protein A